jgi:hypothetical protein
MALRAPGRDNHCIPERSLARQVDADNVVSLGVLERVDDEVGEGGGSRGGAFCAARFEFSELMSESLWPQRNNPSSVLLRLRIRINTSTEEMCITFVEFSRQFVGAADLREESTQAIIELEEAASCCLIPALAAHDGV